MAVKTNNIVEPPQLKDQKKHLKAAALRAYAAPKKQSLENQRIAQLLPMVPKIAQRVVTYLKPPLSFEDIVSAGTLGLIKAAKDYDPSHNAEFKTYAYIRIKGAILDELRGSSSLPAGLNKQIQKAFNMSRKIIEQTGTPPSDNELAEKLGITIDKLYETLENARAQHFVSIDSLGDNIPPLGNILPADNTSTPDQLLEKTELINNLTEAVQQLPEKKRQIIILYYQQHLTMKQIAKVFNITEPRVSQLHASALFNLSLKLKQFKDAR